MDGSCATCKHTHGCLYRFVLYKIVPDRTVAEVVAKETSHERVVYFPRTRTALARVVRSISTIIRVDRRLPHWASSPLHARPVSSGTSNPTF